MLVLTVKDLTEREREVLAAQGAKVFAKGGGWRQQLLAQLRGLRYISHGKRVRWWPTIIPKVRSRELVRAGLG